MSERMDVLLVDDSDADARMTLAGVRRGSPHCSSLRVKDGDQALQFLFHKGLFSVGPKPPRLILLELNIPLVPGVTVLDRIRADVTTSSIPVVVLTTNRNPLVIEDAYARGARAYLVKPKDAGEYVSEVARLVKRFLDAPAAALSGDLVTSPSF